MASYYEHDEKGLSAAVESRPGTSSSESTAPPRGARFAEATAVNSPVDRSNMGRSPFADPPSIANRVQQPSDVGFGYIREPDREIQSEKDVEMPKSPLKSALKSPGAPPRQIEALKSPTFNDAIMSPTFKEEQRLEKREKLTEKSQARDLRIKFRVRVAKMILRGVNFSCSLIVVGMLAATFNIFNATRNLPTRNTLPAWTPETTMWPQTILISIGSVSLVAATIIFFGYLRGGHRKAEKVSVYYTVFAVGFFFVSILMWVIGAALLQGNRAKSGGQDLWGWSCKHNDRELIFQSVVNYSLVCRLQNWTLVCSVIEIIVETLAIIIYGFVFYRYWSKRKLNKSMAVRDRARSDLYLAQLRSQSAPPTPGLPLSPHAASAEGAYNPMFSPRFAPQYQYQEKSLDDDEYSLAESGKAESVQYVSAKPAQPKPFTLKAPPKASPKSQQGSGFSSRQPTPIQTQQSAQEFAAPPMSPTYAEPLHSPAAPGERIYESVPIPGAYTPVQSPTYPPPTHSYFPRQ